MKNLTISMDDELYRKTRIEAAKAGKSMSAYVAARLTESSREEQIQDRQNPLLESLQRMWARGPLHIAENGRMPTADERNER